MWAGVEVAVLSMGNPHAVQRVDDVDAAPVAVLGPAHRDPRALCPPRQRRLHAGAGAATPSACACTSAAPARRWPAAPAPAPRWWPASGWAGWTRRVEVHTRGGALLVEWPARRRQRADDRPGRDRLRRRDRTVTTTPPGLDAGGARHHRDRHRQLPGQHARLLRAPCRVAVDRAADQPARPARRVAAGAADGNAARAHQGAGAARSWR